MEISHYKSVINFFHMFRSFFKEHRKLEFLQDFGATKMILEPFDIDNQAADCNDIIWQYIKHGKICMELIDHEGKSKRKVKVDQVPMLVTFLEDREKGTISELRGLKNG